MEPPQEILLIYKSVASRLIPTEELVQMLAKARVNNQSLNVSGMLLHVDGSFFQVLEGDPASVTDLFAVIARDKRHTAVVKLIEEPISGRTFDQWSMGLAEASRAELSKIPGLNDFFGKGASLSALESGRAKTLLDAFRSGQWRGRLKG